jgi:hypothetical protein
MRISTFFIPLAYPSPYEVPLNLWQGPALSLRYRAPEVEQRDQGEGTKQEETPSVGEPRIGECNKQHASSAKPTSGAVGGRPPHSKNEKTPGAASQHKGV